ncbi:MAG: hypothetical protein AB7E05_13675 [Sphingobium sp.]
MTAPQFRMNVLVERQFEGRRAQLVELDWDAGAETEINERDVVLYLRLKPDTIENVGLVDGDKSERYGQLMMRTPNGEVCTRAGNAVGKALVACCRFKLSWLSGLVGENIDSGHYNLSHDLDFHNDDLLRTMRRLAWELASPGHFSDTLVEALVNTAGIEKMIQHKDGHPGEILLKADHVAVRGRRLMEKIIRAEAAAGETPSAGKTEERIPVKA